MSNSYAACAGACEPSVTASAIVAQAVGSHTLRIDGYSQIKGLGIGKRIVSEEFPVGGHRWRVDFYPDGSSGLSSSDWISVFLRLDRTSDDEVKAKLTASLLDQEGNPVPSYSQQSVMRTFSLKEGGDTSWGYREFIKRSDLEGSVHLKDDVFSVRFDVTVAKEIFTKTIPVPAVRHGV